MQSPQKTCEHLGQFKSYRHAEDYEACYQFMIRDKKKWENTHSATSNLAFTNNYSMQFDWNGNRSQSQRDESNVTVMWVQTSDYYYLFLNFFALNCHAWQMVVRKILDFSSRVGLLCITVYGLLWDLVTPNGQVKNSSKWINNVQIKWLIAS